MLQCLEGVEEEKRQKEWLGAVVSEQSLRGMECDWERKKEGEVIGHPVLFREL